MSKTSGSVLVLTQEIDPTADPVIAQLNMLGVDVIRFDLAEFPVNVVVEASIGDTVDAWTGALGRPRRSIHLGQVRSVWWRRPTWFNFPETLSPEERIFARHEATAGIGGLIRLQDCFWMNHPEHEASADFKPVQLQAARRAGLEIPRSLITNSAARAREFIRANKARGRRTIYKTLAYATVQSPVTGDEQVIYTSVVEDDQLDDHLVAVTTCLFQEEVPKSLELRVIVVGSDIYVAGMNALGSERGRIDFRTAYEDIGYEPHVLPDSVKQALLDLTRNLRLTFGAIDVIVTPDDRYVFLEINPSGQWAWLDHELELSIDKGIASLLADPQHAPQASVLR